METDYLRPVGKTGRVVAGILCTFFSALFLLVGVVFGLDALRPKIDSPGDSSWTAATIVIGIGLFMGFFGWRILRGTNSANGVTSTPTWFLQLC